MHSQIRYRNGFTLIELLLVLTVIAIMASLYIAAVNPAGQIDQVRDIDRKRSANQIQQALYEYLINNNEFPEPLPDGKTNAKPICREGLLDNSCINLDVLVPNYRSALPIDPAETNSLFSGYAVYAASGRAIVIATHIGL